MLPERMAADYGISSLHVIDSLGGKDLGSGLKLKARLEKKAGTLKDLPIVCHDADGRDDVFRTLTKIYQEEAICGLVPILHFEVHGDAVGIHLRNGTIITWSELGHRLRAFNLATRFNLLVVFACCDGIHQIQVLNTSESCPFTAVVGCQGTIRTSELLDGFERFYEIIVNEGKGLAAEAALQAAVSKSAGTQFRLLSAAHAFASVYANVHRVNSDTQRRRAQIDSYRRHLDRMKALQGNLNPTTEKEISDLLLKTEEDTLRRFFESFFACAQIPENRSRFDYASVSKRARAAAESH